MAASEEDYNSNYEYSLSKSVSTPTKCSSCQKIMFFKAYRCKHCRYRCHKKCAGHSGNNSRRNSTHKQYAGEEHWTKVLQANEVNSNVVAIPCNGKHVVPHVCCDPSGPGDRPMSPRSPPKSPKDKDTNIFTTLYSRFCEWVQARKGESSILGGRRSRRGSRGSSRGSGSTTPRGFGHRSRSGSCQSLSSKQQQAQIQQHLQHLEQSDIPSLFLPASPEELHRCYHASVSSEDSELSSFYLASYSSTCSSLTLTSNSTTTSEKQLTDPWSGLADDTRFSPEPWATASQPGGGVGEGATERYRQFSPESWDDLPVARAASCEATPCATVEVQYDSQDSRPRLSSREARSDIKRLLGDLGRSRSRGTDGNSAAALRRGRFTRSKLPSVSVWQEREQLVPADEQTVRCATWPPASRRNHYNFEVTEEVKDEEDLDESVFEEFDHDFPCSQSHDIRDSLGECNIPYSDLCFGQSVRVGRRHHIFTGRWHGDVMIHTHSDLSEEEVSEFWREVSKLSMIRHENVALFMGACLDPPNLAVITSNLKGTSLYAQLHMKSEKLSMHNRVGIIRQVAQGMGYLHAKGIVLRKLNSKNIHLEPKVKICFMDYGMAESRLDRSGYGCIPRGNLCYIAPEMMRTLRVVAPSLKSLAPFTKDTDVYAFGTVVFELMAGQFPFARTCPEILIWQVGRGKRQSTRHLKCNAALRLLAERCWSKTPDHRPTFADVNMELLQNAALHKRHSSSEPEKLNRIGLPGRTSVFP